MHLPRIYTSEIEPQWLDYNNHLNVAYYVLIFDRAGEKLVDTLGLGEQETRRTGNSWAVLENHITYDREVLLGQTVEIGVQLLDYDQKRLHLYFEMYVTSPEQYLAATLEQMIMGLNLKTRRSTDLSAHVQANIKTLAQEQLPLQPPANIGRKIGIRRREKPVSRQG